MKLKKEFNMANWHKKIVYGNCKKCGIVCETKNRFYAICKKCVKEYLESLEEMARKARKTNKPKKEKTTFEKAKEIFKPKKISEAEKDEIARNFNSLVKAYGYELENEGAVAIEGILKICKIHTEANRGGRDELMTLPFERKQELIPILKKAI